jgi:hypothetical protein
VCGPNSEIEPNPAVSGGIIVVLAIVFASIWGVVQLVILGSFARTVRLRTVFAAFAAGLYVAAPASMLLEVIWTRIAAAVIGTPVYDLVRSGSYTVDPFIIEEPIKVLPLALLLLIPTIRRQWSITDCVLVGAALGAGFGLAEDLYRYAWRVQSAIADDRGWTLAINIGLPWVPNLSTSATSWLPESPQFQGFGVATFPQDPVNTMLVCSTLGGLAVGLILLRRHWLARIAGVAVLLFAGGLHAAENASLTVGVPSSLQDPLNFLSDAFWSLPLIALAIAWLLDRPRQRAGDTELLRLEHTSPLRWPGTVRAAVGRLPWSLAWVSGFVRLRRCYSSARLAGGAEVDTLRTAVLHVRDRIDRALAGPIRLQLLPPGWTAPAFLARHRAPATILWIVLMTPSALWFIVGGLPQSAGVQAALIGDTGWQIVRAMSAFALVWLAWQLIMRFEAWDSIAKHPVGDVVATSGLQIISAIGAVGLGGFTWIRAFTGLTPSSTLISNSHSVEAFSSSPLAGALLIADTGVSVLPPWESGATAATGAGETVATGTAVGAGAVTGVGVGVGLAGLAVGAAAAVGLPMMIDHANEVSERPDPDIQSPPGGTPILPPRPDTIPSPPTPWPAPPGNPAPDIAPGEPNPYPGDPTNPVFPGPPRVPTFESAPPKAPPAPNPRPYPPDWQHGAPTRPVPPDPNVAPDPTPPPPPPPKGPYR